MEQQPLPRYETLEDLAAKIDWEGGIVDTLDCGLRSTDIADPQAAAIWAELERIYDNQMYPLMERLHELLPDNY